MRASIEAVPMKAIQGTDVASPKAEAPQYSRDGATEIHNYMYVCMYVS